MFDTVLVANRGEIAVRIIRTLRAMGIKSVAVYSDADAGALHVALADQAVRIGPAAAAHSYLDIDAVISAARATGAQAVHPGYGFLSENLDFARALEAAGIVFIGPPVNSINLMGDKIRSKNHVSSHGVPVVPGISEPGLSDAQLIAAAEDVGFPLLIKPSAGGGGKGMFSVFSPGDLPEALASARRTAASAFGDDTRFLERLVASPRHIEVQVLADAHGSTVYLGERECSLQRRHQKVIEEAPAPLLENLPEGAEIRARLGEAAVAAAKSVGYVGAGTVEFLVSDEKPGEFFFMEMNTRLQVEHPVTEEVLRVAGRPVDLVEYQVRISAGAPLDFAQDDVELVGHAIEARLYAEDPAADFLPSTGTVHRVHEPQHLRIDSALRQGLEISPHYDPMLAKLIARGADRTEALSRLDRALAETVVLGVKTNAEYLRLLLADEDVAAGRLDTTLIERRSFDFRQVGIAELAYAALEFADPSTGTSAGAWARDSWRLGDPAARRLLLETGGRTEVVIVDNGTVQVGEEAVSARRTAAGIELDGVLAKFHSVRVGDELWLSHDGFTARITRAAAVHAAGEGEVCLQVSSPMPGTVIAVPASDGDQVAAGDVLLIVEAMKMEHQLRAPAAGIVRMNTLKPGDLVKAQQVLASIEEQA
ncbi:acetyl/propionyl-CoA carboxylase subuit alpha [Glutamicibacter uratoxydans]|uniref:biotin carboxylase n=1 Tax=Glutamicibacter uratoxydans TaxID=43667 RepID=A0A4Y4DIM2_GLUUR|nr:biotin carboxylase N-terminal domain-containing protein [Glutamicibacter uratoxydans]GED05139.1 acetyl/propionyl-CoA carboxylase subuit alpha [Glutamicibacter uratoxydans]